eukprot:9987314-Karenia_brevis.AAC.1
MGKPRIVDYSRLADPIPLYSFQPFRSYIKPSVLTNRSFIPLHPECATQSQRMPCPGCVWTPWTLRGNKLMVRKILVIADPDR